MELEKLRQNASVRNATCGGSARPRPAVPPVGSVTNLMTRPRALQRVQQSLPGPVRRRSPSRVELQLRSNPVGCSPSGAGRWNQPPVPGIPLAVGQQFPLRRRVKLAHRLGMPCPLFHQISRLATVLSTPTSHRHRKSRRRCGGHRAAAWLRENPSEASLHHDEDRAGDPSSYAAIDSSVGN